MRLGDNRFFNLFALLAASTNPDRNCDSWQVGSVCWTRERTTHRAPHYSFQIEIHTLVRDGRAGWILLMARETWWEGGKVDAFRNGHWVHLVRGARADVLGWFAAREKELA